MEETKFTHRAHVRLQGWDGQECTSRNKRAIREAKVLKCLPEHGTFMDKNQLSIWKLDGRKPYQLYQETG